MLSRMPLRHGLAHPHRRPAVPHVGLRPPRAGDAAGLHGRAAPPLRPRARAAHRRAGALRVAGRDPGDAPADPGPRRGGAGALLAARRCGSSPRPARRCPATLAHLAGWTTSATTSTTSTAPPRSPTPRSRRPRTCAGRPRRPATRRTATVVRIYDEDGHEVPPGDVGPHLRRQRPALRGLHRRRQQGHDRRADVDRRRGPLRRRRAPVRRRARRRDDRLRRRERLPQGGRGLPGRPRGGGRGRRRSAWTTTTTARG